MIYLGIITGIFVLDFFIKRYVDKKYERKVKHPKLGGLAYIEKYYNDGAMLNLYIISSSFLPAQITQISQVGSVQ